MNLSVILLRLNRRRHGICRDVVASVGKPRIPVVASADAGSAALTAEIKGYFETSREGDARGE